MPSLTFPITVGTDDGRVLRSSAVSYADVVNATNAYNTSNIRTSAVRSLNAGTYNIQLALLRFNTASIPDTATVTGAVLQLYCTPTLDKFDVDNRNLTGDWTAWTGSAPADWSETAGTDAFSGLDITSISSDGPVNITLSNAVTGVSKTGNTHLRIHVDGGAPTGRNEMGFATYDHTTLQEPNLTVSYTYPVDIGGGRSAYAMVGEVANIDEDPDGTPDGLKLTPPTV